ncbi:MAG: beta-N-acetylhexosaminidase [Mangrovibacterium sp.]
MQYLFAQGVNSSGSYLIPKPQKESYTGKVLRLPSSVAISTDLDNDARTILGKVFQEVLNVRTSFAPDEKSFVRFHVDQELAAEAYIIKTDRKRIEIYASSPQGSLWAVQTLHQMLKHAGRSGTGNPKYLPAGEIEDFPVHQWRSFHLDVARHFFTKEFLFRTIERLSFYKINKLHLHLSDDQGWRIEIDKYPLLTGIGGWRTFDRFDSICIRKARLDPDMEIDKRFIRQDSMYGGFYTKADMKAIIGHAKKYRIEIIPEIDMPGHMSAAIRAYPWLSCTGNPGWGKEFSHPVCVCDPRVIDFAKDVYEEITALFPSEYIHIGADEVEKDSWEADHDCQELIKEKGLESPEGLQTLFVNEMHQFLKEKGKKNDCLG